MIGGMAIPRLSQRWAACLSAVILGLVAVGDSVTAWYYIFDFFYLLPLSLTTVYLGKRWGYLMSLLCTAVWTLAMTTQGHPLVLHHPEPSWLIWAWNFLMRMVIQSSFVWLLDRLVTEAARQKRQASELRAALDQVNQLRALIPICAWCKKVRNDAGYWQQVDHYLQERDLATFTHGICPDCEHKALGT
jgi:hypothetical protein